MNDSSVIIIQHISYDNLAISYDHLKNIKIIRLNRTQNNLPEVTVVGSKYNKPEILVLKGYYRSYQLEDSIPKYYTDGIVEYYISKKRKKGLKNRVIEYRSYRNEELVKKEKQRANMVSMVVAGVPYINSLTIIDDLDKNYSIQQLSDHQIIKRDNSTVGIIRTNKPLNRVQIDIDLIAPQKEKTRSLFKYTSKITHINITENYSFQGLSKLSKDNLESRKEYRQIYFKHKKDKDFVEIDVIHEFYVLEKRYLTKEELKDIKTSSFFGLQRSHSYSHEYWKDLDKNHIPKLNKNIENLLGTKLKLYK